MKRRVFLVLLLCFSAGSSSQPRTFDWDAGANWPAGTQVELTVNGISSLHAPNATPTINIVGNAINAKARAIPPSGYQCGDPLVICPPSGYVTLTTVAPNDPVNIVTNYEQVQIMPATQVQKKKYAAPSASTSHSVVFDSAPTQGNLLILCVVGDAIVNTPSGWDQAVDSVNFTDTGIYYKTAGASESTTITVSLSGSAKAVMLAYEYSGMTNALDKTASATSSASTIASGTTATITVPDQLLVALFGINQSTSGTVSSYSNSFVQDDFADTGNTGADVAGYVAMRTVSTTGAYSTTATLNDFHSGNSGVIATFPIAASASVPRTLATLGVGR